MEPYNIYYENRPLRIAFLVNPDCDQSLLEQIIDYNRSKWGGRYNPIIVTDGNAIDENWWQFLRSYDPDIIYSTLSLSDDIKEKFKIFLTPLYTEIVRDIDNPTINLSNDPISILPSSDIIRSISLDMLDRESTLALFEIDDNVPNIVKTFVERNFGNYKTGNRVPFHQDKAIKSCKTKVFTISDISGLNEMLKELGDFRNKYIFPSQICSEANHVKDVDYDHNRESFEVIIGDSNDDLIYFWNRQLQLRSWLRTKFSQLWLPAELAIEQSLKEGLGAFINRYTGSIGNQTHLSNFVSYSIESDELKEIKESIQETLFHPRQHNKLNEIQIPNFGETYIPYIIRKGLDFFRANSNEEHIAIPEPRVEESGMGGQHWITDFYIQYRPEINKTIIGKDYWWQFPKRNSVVQSLQVINKPSRVNENHMISSLMKRNSPINQLESTLIIKLPEDTNIFRSLILGESYKNISTDPGEAFSSSPYYNLRVSKMGKPLVGILSLFPDLHGAFRLVEERYVRRIFELMSNKRTEKDTQLLSDIAAKFKQKVDSGIDLTSEEGLEWLAEKSIKISKDIGNKDKALQFKHFVLEAKSETKEYNEANPSNQFKVDDSDLKDKITDLIESGIILVGININCPRCGEKNWIHIDSITQNVLCKSCRYEFTVPAEQGWSYKLNSMVRDAFAEYGTVPVLLVLGQLFMDAKTSFMYIPCSDLIVKGDDDKLEIETDLDVACIVDGQFVIGEIKQSTGGFRQKDFDEMEVVAKKIKPDKIIFSSLEPVSDLVNQRISGLQEKIKDLEIKVEWYPLPRYMFEASPVS